MPNVLAGADPLAGISTLSAERAANLQSVRIRKPASVHCTVNLPRSDWGKAEKESITLNRTVGFG
jgi:hypothetical protein